MRVPQESTKRQQRAAATAEQLQAAAREVFESRGYAATTVGAITKAANTAHGTFYLHFKNKEDALGRVMEAVIDEMTAEARAPWTGDPYQQLLRANHRYLEVFNNHKGLWRCLIEGLHQSKAVEAMWLDLRRPFIEQLARHLARLSESGAIRRLDAVETAYALGSMVEWFAFTHLVLGEPPLTEDSIDKAAVTLTDLWFHAVYGRDREVAD